MLPAYATRDNLRLGVELGEEVVLANVSEWEKKAAEAATQAEEYAQSALKAESRGDMTVASILWGDSWSFDRQAQNYSAEAARYGEMLKPPMPLPPPESMGTRAGKALRCGKESRGVVLCVDGEGGDG